MTRCEGCNIDIPKGKLYLHVLDKHEVWTMNQDVREAMLADMGCDKDGKT